MREVTYVSLIAGVRTAVLEKKIWSSFKVEVHTFQPIDIIHSFLIESFVQQLAFGVFKNLNTEHQNNIVIHVFEFQILYL